MPLRQLLAGIIIVMCLCTGLLGQTGTLTVKVRDAATEEPLRQAQVTLSTFGGGSDSHRAFTDNTGTAILSGLLVGNYYLEVRAPGYLPSRESIDLPTGAMQSADVGLRVEQKAAPGLPGSTTTADELGVPKKARKHFEEGARKVDGDPQEAARSFQKAIDEYPQFARAYAMLGVCQMRLKQWDAAEQSAKKATEIDPAMSMAHTLLAKIYLQQNNFTEAEAQLLEAARLDPESWEAPYQLARCYSSTKQFDKAMASGLRAHAMSSSPATVHLLMVDLYSAVHDRAGALRELEEYAKADPKSPYMAAVRKRIDDLKKN